MHITVTVDTRELDGKLYELSKYARVAPGVVMREETRQLAQALIRMTPPKTYAQGRARISGDLSKIAVPIDADFAKSGQFGTDADFKSRLSEVIRIRDVDAIDAMMRNVKHRFWMGRTTLRDQSALRGSHVRNRNARGRTSRQHQIAFGQDWREYRKELWSRVGWAKSGWVSVLRACGGTAPSWISRLASVSGQAFANFGEKPSVSAVNYNVKIPGYQRMVDTAVRARIRATETKIKRLIDGKAVNLGFATIGARR